MQCHIGVCVHEDCVFTLSLGCGGHETFAVLLAIDLPMIVDRQVRKAVLAFNLATTSSTSVHTPLRSCFKKRPEDSFTRWMIFELIFDFMPRPALS
jgi:hypothetical protein